MRVGFKVYASSAGYATASSWADFIEVLAEPGVPLEPLRALGKEIFVHAPHHKFGFDPVAAPGKSRSLLVGALAAADELGARRVVVHAASPGTVPRPEAAVAFFREFRGDERILIENMCPLLGAQCGFCAPDELTRLLGLGFGLCLDFSHALVTATHRGVGFRELVDGLLGLGPSYFHLTGNKAGSLDDPHLPLAEADYDLEFARRAVRGDVCLETPFGSWNAREAEWLKTGRPLGPKGF